MYRVIVIVNYDMGAVVGLFVGICVWKQVSELMLDFLLELVQDQINNKHDCVYMRLIPMLNISLKSLIIE